eukprot:452367_1
MDHFDLSIDGDDEKYNNDHNTNNSRNGRRPRDWGNHYDSYALPHQRRRLNHSNSYNNYNNNNNHNIGHINMKHEDTLTNTRRFTLRRTLRVENIPYAIKAIELMNFLNTIPVCKDAVHRVQFNSYEPHKHNGKGRVLFKTTQITKDVLHYDDNNKYSFGINFHNQSPFIIRNRTLRFRKWNRKKHNIIDTTDNKYDEEDDKMFNLGAGDIMFGHKSYPYIINHNHTEPFDQIAFDFIKRCIRVQSTFPIASLSPQMVTPKADEYRIRFKDIIQQIYYQKENILIINLYHPLQRYKIFPDTQYEDFDTEKSLCQTIKRSICHTKFASNMFVRIKLKYRNDKVLNDCFDLLKKYNLLTVSSSTFNIHILSQSQSNNFTISNPPNWIYKLPEHIQYLLACLHTKQPSKNQENYFIQLLCKKWKQNIITVMIKPKIME